MHWMPYTNMTRFTTRNTQASGALRTHTHPSIGAIQGDGQGVSKGDGSG